MNASLSRYTIIIPAGTVNSPGIAKAEAAGAVFFCYFASGFFTVQFDNGEEIPFSSGIATPAGSFRSQTFFNPTSIPVSVIFYVSQAAFQFFPTQLSLLTYAKGQPVNLANNSVSGLIQGLDNGNPQKQIVFTLSNYSGAVPNPNVQILDQNGNPLFPLVYLVPLTLETIGPFKISRSNDGWGGNMLVTVAQIFYQVQ